MPDCAICCEPFNKSTRLPITCCFVDCEFITCKCCTRKYLLETTADPHCMNCKKAWTDAFLVKNLNRSFCEKEYKLHRKNLLTEREISKLPQTMQFAENQRFIDEEKDKIKSLNEKMLQLKKQVNEIKTQQISCHNAIYNISNGNQNNEKRKFIMACPTNSCRGYLSTQYKCELCKVYTCPTCLDSIGHNKHDPHTCNPDNVTSAELIKKETKPCPSCGVRIFKIDGCNQMWCTECKVAFDYVSGRIDKGTVHNPHYYAHLHNNQNGAIPRNPGDILCGGLCIWHDLQYIIIKKLGITWRNDPNLKDIISTHRSINHITNYELFNTRRMVRELLNLEPLRADYILKKKTKDQFMNLIFRKDTLRKKYNDLLHIYEFISVVGIETFNILKTSNLKNEDYWNESVQKLKELDAVRCICNEQFQKISNTYNNKTLYIGDDWTMTNRKY